MWKLLGHHCICQRVPTSHVPHMDCDDNNLEAWHLKSAVRMAFVGCAALAILITIYFHSIVLK